MTIRNFDKNETGSAATWTPSQESNGTGADKVLPTDAATTFTNSDVNPEAESHAFHVTGDDYEKICATAQKLLGQAQSCFATNMGTASHGLLSEFPTQAELEHNKSAELRMNNMSDLIGEYYGLLYE
jgi:hypothetical protein